MKTRIILEDVLEDGPQHRTLVQLFEEDSHQLLGWSKQLLAAVTEWSFAQKRLGEAASILSGILASYSSQKFVLDDVDLEIPRVTEKLARTFEDTSGWMEVVGQQLDNCVRYPIGKLCRELESLMGETRGTHMAAHDLLMEAEDRFLKCGRKDSVSKFEELNQNIYMTKMNYHKIALSYCARMNSIQHLRYTNIIEPMLSLIYAYKSFYNAGHEAMKQQDITTFLSNTQEKMQRVVKDSEAERVATKDVLLTFETIQSSEANLYLGEPIMKPDDRVLVETQKQGYLRMKVKSGLFGSNWDRLYVFIQGTSMMSQKDVSSGCSVVLDLAVPNVSAEECPDCERRFVFTIKDNKEKRFLMQARNTQDMREWIATINSISGYTTASPSHPSSLSSPKHSPSREVPMQILEREESGMIESSTPPMPIQFDLMSIGKLPEGFEETNTTPLQAFDVDFLGSLEISQKSEGNEGVQKAIDTVKESREKYSVEDKQRFKLMICESRLVLKDAENCLRASFDFPNIALWVVSKTHPNTFAMTTSQDPSSHSVCSVFESVDGNPSEVCASLARATTLALAKVHLDTPHEEYESLSAKTKLDRELSG